MPGCHRQAQGWRPAISERLFAPVHACRCCGLPSPCQSAPGSPSLGFIYRRSRPRITTGYTCDKRSAYLWGFCGVARGQFRFFFYAQDVDCILPGEGHVIHATRQHDPQHFPTTYTGSASFYTSNPHGCTQSASKVHPDESGRAVPNHGGLPRRLTARWSLTSA
jgi:hypothetical protein